MRRISLVAVVALLLGGAVFAPVVASEPVVAPLVGVHLSAFGPIGELTFVNAQGMPYEARVGGQMVAGGVVLTPQFTVPVVGVDLGPVEVHVGPADVTLLSGDWEWDGGTW